MRWVGHVANMGEEKRVYVISGKQAEGRPTRGLVDNIKMDHRVMMGY
jgi:hypothetical protein